MPTLHVPPSIQYSEHTNLFFIIIICYKNPKNHSCIIPYSPFPYSFFHAFLHLNKNLLNIKSISFFFLSSSFSFFPSIYKSPKFLTLYFPTKNLLTEFLSLLLTKYLHHQHHSSFFLSIITVLPPPLILSLTI